MTVSFDILERNLAALRVRQPEAAAMINSCELPEGLVPIPGRDGTATLMVPGDNGPVWLGGSSMPRASAEEMFGHVEPRGGSVTLPAMLTGMEAIVLAERLAAPFAVFVVDEPRAFKTVLSLRDYDSYFQAGRIVLLLSDDVPARAREFFSRNSGYLMPAHMFRVPQLPAGHLANLARTLENAGAQVIAAQNEIIATLVQRLQNDPAAFVSEAPSVAVLAADDLDATTELARRLLRGFNAIPTACTACLPVNPSECHIAARLAEVEQAWPNLIVYVSGISDAERTLYPKSLPVIDWLPNSAILRRRTSSGDFDVVVVSSRTDHDKAVATGVPRDRVLHLEPAADLIYEETSGDAPSVNEKSAVVVIMDLPDDRPEAVGLNLPSHIALWKALQQEVLRRSDRYTPGDVGVVLQAAQQSSGTVLTDPTLSASFDHWLRSHVAPATIARSLALALVKSGFEPEIWGRHWPVLGRGKDLRRGTVPLSSGLHAVLERPAWVVIPWFSHAGVQMALDAMSRGNVVNMRGPRESFITEYPGLAELSASIQWFDTAAELVATLRGLISRDEAAAEKARIVSRQIRVMHTIKNRLQTVIQHVRVLQQSSTPQGNA